MARSWFGLSTVDTEHLEHRFQLPHNTAEASSYFSIVASNIASNIIWIGLAAIGIFAFGLAKKRFGKIFLIFFNCFLPF